MAAAHAEQEAGQHAARLETTSRGNWPFAISSTARRKTSAGPGRITSPAAGWPTIP